MRRQKNIRGTSRRASSLFPSLVLACLLGIGCASQRDAQAEPSIPLVMGPALQELVAQYTADEGFDAEDYWFSVETPAHPIDAVLLDSHILPEVAELVERGRYSVGSPRIGFLLLIPGDEWRNAVANDKSGESRAPEPMAVPDEVAALTLATEAMRQAGISTDNMQIEMYSTTNFWAVYYHWGWLITNEYLPVPEGIPHTVFVLVSKRTRKARLSVWE